MYCNSTFRSDSSKNLTQIKHLNLFIDSPKEKEINRNLMIWYKYKDKKVETQESIKERSRDLTLH